MKNYFWLCLGVSVFSFGVEQAAFAQVPPAPTLATTPDTDGRPLPFGRRTREASDKPLGSGAYKAIMAEESLPAHVAYYPADLKVAGKLPIIAWGNGACINAGNRFRYFLTEIASHGYLVLASGPMANVDLEVGPQENPAIRNAGAEMLARVNTLLKTLENPAATPAAPPALNNNTRAPGRTTAEQLTEAIDWAVKQNDTPESKFYHRLDTTKVAVMGQSCGGVQALTVAGDPRIKTMMIWNSAVGMIPNNPSDPKKALAAIHTPIAYVYGDEAHDIAYPGATQNVQVLEHVPVFGVWQDGMTHLGTYGAQNGGFFAKIAVSWLNWQLKGDNTAAKMFKGGDCILCRDASLHVTKKKID